MLRQVHKIFHTKDRQYSKHYILLEKFYVMIIHQQ